MKRLFDSLYRACMDNPWAPDHKQIAGALLQARKMVVEFDCADAIAAQLEFSPWLTEKRIHRIQWPKQTTWIEWPLPASIVRNVGQGATTGVLIIPHPDFEDVVVIITGWRSNENEDAKHSYATAIISKSTLSKNSMKNAVYLKKDRFLSHQRILDKIGVNISTDLKDELLLKYNFDAEVIGEAYKSATAEIPFVLSVLLFIGDHPHTVVEQEEEWKAIVNSPSEKMGVLRKMRKILSSKIDFRARNTH